MARGQASWEQRRALRRRPSSTQTTARRALRRTGGRGLLRTSGQALVQPEYFRAWPYVLLRASAHESSSAHGQRPLLPPARLDRDRPAAVTPPRSLSSSLSRLSYPNGSPFQPCICTRLMECVALLYYSSSIPVATLLASPERPGRNKNARTKREFENKFARAAPVSETLPNVRTPSCRSRPPAQRIFCVCA